MNYFKSVVYSDDEAISTILTLHTKGSIDLDVTYSKGNFYKGSITQPVHKFDLHPQIPGVEKANAESIPLPDHSVNTIMFDPPFLATKGPSLTSSEDNNIIQKRFGVYPTEKELHSFYIKAMQEQYRLLREDGILIFKCQDKVSSGKQYMSHVFIINEAEKIGFYCKDILILIAKSRIVAPWQTKNQKHVRKFHSYYLVFEKSNKKIQFT